ncbi:DNA-directed RNA polymerase subunit beta [Bacillus testis]|uniref:DNA-directed RNA polymerase subunit beta n=1 Tax=Bacillus testis TaxID=1622072 RepID=UPI00067E9D8A|nr:DNA-directed RNA polymerase subunit beta [Bacillus testis]
MEQEILTRQGHKQVQMQTEQKKTREKIRIRLIPIWMRILLLAVAIVLATAIGCVVGYSVIGDGKPSEVFQKETWLHIRDLVKQGS